MLTDPSFPVLRTDRLVLRQLAVDDSRAWFRSLSDVVVTELIGMDPLETVEEIGETIDRYTAGFEEGAMMAWAITLRESSQFIGTCSYEHINSEDHSGVIGYDLLREHWGQGFMTEALRAIIDYGFKKLGLNLIQANTDPTNTPSRNLLKRLGFLEEGTFRESAHFTGEFGDDRLYSLTRSQWHES
jgi:ribosomal-protein-alanine N-acetyltransferase